MNIVISGAYSTSLTDLLVPDRHFRQLRRADDYIRMGVVAADSVMVHNNRNKTSDGSKTGLIVGSAFGPMQTNFEVLDQVVDHEPVSPTLFSHSVFNAAAGYIATVLNINGYLISFTDFGFPFFRALEQGVVAIKSGRLDSCLVLQVETYSDLLQDVKFKQIPDANHWESGVVCWLLEKRGDQPSTQYSVGELEIRTGRSLGASCLQVHERVHVLGDSITLAGYLGAASYLTSIVMKRKHASTLVCAIDSSYGMVKISLK